MSFCEMMDNEITVLESFDKPYPVTRHPTAGSTFTADNGSTFNVTFFIPSSASGWGKNFAEFFPTIAIDDRMRVVSAEFTVTNAQHGYKFLNGTKLFGSLGENPMRILSTVAKEVVDYCLTNRVDVIEFSGEQKLGSIYQRMLKKYLPATYVMRTAQSTNGIQFLIHKKGIFL